MWRSILVVLLAKSDVALKHGFPLLISECFNMLMNHVIINMQDFCHRMCRDPFLYHRLYQDHVYMNVVREYVETMSDFVYRNLSKPNLFDVDMTLCLKQVKTTATCVETMFCMILECIIAIKLHPLDFGHEYVEFRSI